MEERNLRKTRIGIVVSDKMDKTITVAIQDNVRHPLYNKIVKKWERISQEFRHSLLRKQKLLNRTLERRTYRGRKKS